MNSFVKAAARPLLCVLVVALIVRLVAGLWWQSRLPPGTQFAFADSESYWVLARQIAHAEPYQFGSPDARIFRAPLYPLLLAPLFWIGGDDVSVSWARALGALLGVGSVAAVHALALRLFDARTALLAAAIAAVYPGAVATSVFVLSEAVFCPLMVTQLALSIAAWQADDTKTALQRALLAGGVAALAALARPSWLLFAPLVAIVSLFARRDRARHALLAIATVVGLIVIMTPWWVRNARLTGHFVPTTLQVGASLYDAWNPVADGGSNMKPVAEYAASIRAQLPPDEPIEYSLDHGLRTAAIDWAKNHPRRAIELAGVKLVRMWNIWPNEPAFRGWPLRLLVLFTYTPLMALAIVAAWRFRHDGLCYAMCWLPAVYLTVLHVVFVSSIRYREPAMLPLIVLAAAVLTHASTKGTIASAH